MKNVSIMWFANFFIAGSITMVQPFLSLYIDSLGDFSSDYVQTASGFIFSVTFVAAFLFSPIWGRVGDRIGRKPILVVFAFGLGLSLFLMGFVTSVIQLFFLRLFMGIFTGFISLSQALISTQASKRVAGKVLGTLQTGSITGTLMGPLLGGVLADLFGYQATFKWLSLVLFAASFLVLFGIKEFTYTEEEGAPTGKYYSSRQVLLHILRHPVLLVIMLMSMIVQIANFSIQPILPLFVGELHGPANIAFFSGLAFSAAGLGNLLMSRRIGRLGDRYGYVKLLTLMLVLAALVYFPGGFVTALWQLIILRFLMGIFIGGVIPLRIAYIRQAAPIEMQGEVLGYNTSLRFFGNMIGPLLGATISASFGFSAVFLSTSGLLLISALLMIFAMKKYPNYAGNGH
ncbi:putative MFS family arabinose efflux permease [Streptohalobacillus salinus]|uniref:Putative MFS family arabinose efflux permease n=1 Tax=Streptohalobacillus salinus TaxID=621096 RepID=A0A2V3WTL5_9BACI|nr:MFS transporter [Streptohalobacillus salinus]PXW92151.1 putative MFS family arabinose efflux permease [Streptohalobacillus salinus]